MTLTSKKPLSLWAEEDQQDILRTRYRVKRTLFSASSEYQQVDVVESAGFGRMLLNDSIVMFSERDEWIYHEMISHVPLFVAPDTRRVLVVGGGDGGTVREVLRHESVTYCRLVEIDGKVIEACREFIPQTASALDDPRVEVTIGDGVAYVARTPDTYDLVIVDSTDPFGPAAPLFGPEFYAGVHRVLTDDGIVVSQAGSPFYDAQAQLELLRILGEPFSRVHVYNYSNMTYPGGLWSFSFAAKGQVCPLGDFDPGRVERSGLDFRYYNPGMHRAAFQLAEFQARKLGEVLTPFKKEPFAP